MSDTGPDGVAGYASEWFVGLFEDIYGPGVQQMRFIYKLEMTITCTGRRPAIQILDRVS